MSIVGDIETIQVRSGDVIILKPRVEMSDARLHAVFEQLKSWIEYKRIKVHVAVMPHDVDIVILREDRKP